MVVKFTTRFCESFSLVTKLDSKLPMMLCNEQFLSQHTKEFHSLTTCNWIQEIWSFLMLRLRWRLVRWILSSLLHVRDLQIPLKVVVADGHRKILSNNRTMMHCSSLSWGRKSIYHVGPINYAIKWTIFSSAFSFCRCLLTSSSFDSHY